MRRRMVDTTRQGDRREWEELPARALVTPVPYRLAPGIAVYHVGADHHVVMIAEHDLAGRRWTWSPPCWHWVIRSSALARTIWEVRVPASRAGCRWLTYRDHLVPARGMAGRS